MTKRVKWKALAIVAVAVLAGLEIFARIFAAFTGSMAAAELAAPVDGLQNIAGKGAPAESQLALREFLHPFLGYAPIPPGSTQSVIRLWFPVRQDVPTNAFIVGLMGGSVAYGLYQSGELQAALARHPELTRGVAPRVIPLCYDGWRQPQPLICLMLAQIENLPLDLVISIDGVNEVKGGLNNIRSQVPVAAPHADVMARLHFLRFDLINTSTLDYLLQCRALMRREQRWLAAARRSPWRYSAFYRLVCLTIMQNARIGKLHLEDRWGRACLRDESPGFALRQSASDEQPEQRIMRYWFQVAASADALCRLADVPYYHFLQPYNYGAAPGKIGSDADDMGESRNRHFLAIYDAMAAKSAGMPYMRDLSHCFTGKDELLFSDECHMNGPGQARLAAAIVDRIVSNTPPARPGK